MRNKILVIVGATAVGKSDLAIELAKKYDGEIISADSRQIYRELNLGTGKVKNDNPSSLVFKSDGIVHHMIDIVDAKEQYSIAEYQTEANKKIREIWEKGKLPIICGGSPLYVISVLEGWQFPKTAPDLSLRNELEKEEIGSLYLKLQQLDPNRSKTIDKDNKRRIIRALEIVLNSKGAVEPLKKVPIDADVLILSIEKERKEIKDLIWKRLEKRIEEGMIEEVQKLKEKGLKADRLDDFGLEYRYLNMYLENKISLPDMKQQLYYKIWQFAKRQLTWFKKFENIIWIKDLKQAIIEIDKKW